VASAAVACTGGGGSLNDSLETWDSPPGSVERGADTREGAPGPRERPPGGQDAPTGSVEPGPGAQSGGGGFDCSGPYTCQEVGDDDRDTITLSVVDGDCTIPVSKTTVFVLAPDGAMVFNGKRVGSWQPTSTGFTASTDEGSIDCTKGGGSSTSASSQAGSDRSSGSGTSSSRPPSGS
jgi:hypothetical protein